MVVGDFNGDLIADVAFAEQATLPAPPASPAGERLAIAFGRALVAPIARCTSGSSPRSSKWKLATTGAMTPSRRSVWPPTGGHFRRGAVLFLGNPGGVPSRRWARNPDRHRHRTVRYPTGLGNRQLRPGCLSQRLGSGCQRRARGCVSLPLWLATGAERARFGNLVASGSLPETLTPLQNQGYPCTCSPATWMETDRTVLSCWRPPWIPNRPWVSGRSMSRPRGGLDRTTSGQPSTGPGN